MQQKSKTLNIAVLQSASLSLQTAKLEYYANIAKIKKCKLLILGEYEVNLFFKELEKAPKNFIKDQCTHQKDTLKRVAISHSLTIIAPMVEFRNNKIYKVIYKFSKTSTTKYLQQILINYEHWNEESFFDNPIEPLKTPLFFQLDGFRCMVFSGFELHFNFFWQEVMRKKIDLVILPTSSTFDSNQRWRELISTKSFLNNCYIIRANRVGHYKDNEFSWDFYGDSIITNPNGDIENGLGKHEELMITSIDLDQTKEARKDWGFNKALKKRGMM